MKPAVFLKKLIQLINPSPRAGGLSISESSIKFILLKDGEKPVLASLRLPPGIIKDGKIKDDKGFREALKNLHSQVAPLRRTLNAVLSLPSEDVYVQSFSMPAVAEEKMKEAVGLNLRMLSPLDAENSYLSFEKLGEDKKGESQLDFLGAFAEAEVVNSYLAALKETNFLVSVVEFPALSLARLLKQERVLEGTGNYLVIDVSNEGIALMIVRHAGLYFSHFHAWSFIKQEAGGKEIEKKFFEDFIIKEIQKLFNFTSTKWKEAVSQVILVSHYLAPDLVKVIKDNFSVPVSEFALKSYSELESHWFHPLGSALRGLLPRFMDDGVSLMSDSVKTEYFHARILNFTSMWRKIALTVLAFFFSVALILSFFLIREESRIEKILSGRDQKEVRKVEELEQKAKEFNNLAKLALEAKNNGLNWPGFFELVRELSGGSLVLKRIAVSGETASITGSGKNEEVVLSFKNRLIMNKNFSDVALPLSGIKVNPDGSADFTITFKVKSWEF